MEEMRGNVEFLFENTVGGRSHELLAGRRRAARSRPRIPHRRPTAGERGEKASLQKLMQSEHVKFL